MNDLFVNFPFAYAMAFPVGLLSRDLFVPAFIAAYWLSNILGLYMMHRGKNMISGKEMDFRDELKSTIVWSTVYTILIFILVQIGILQFPEEFWARITGS